MVRGAVEYLHTPSLSTLANHVVLPPHTLGASNLRTPHWEERRTLHFAFGRPHAYVDNERMDFARAARRQMNASRPELAGHAAGQQLVIGSAGVKMGSGRKKKYILCIGS